APAVLRQRLRPHRLDARLAGVDRRAPAIHPRDGVPAGTAAGHADRQQRVDRHRLVRAHHRPELPWGEEADEPRTPPLAQPAAARPRSAARAAARKPGTSRAAYVETASAYAAGSACSAACWARLLDMVGWIWCGGSNRSASAIMRAAAVNGPASPVRC